MSKPIILNTFAEASDPELFRSQYQNSSTVAKNIPNVVESLNGGEFQEVYTADDDPLVYPAGGQFIDLNNNNALDSGVDVYIALAVSRPGYVYISNPFSPEEGGISFQGTETDPKIIDRISVYVFFPYESKIERENRLELIYIDQPVVPSESGDMLACNMLQDFKVADFDSDGDMDIGFTLVNVDHQSTSLKIYLQEQNTVTKRELRTLY